MDFLDFVLTPAGVVALLVRGVQAGVAVGVLYVALSLMFSRTRL